VAKGSRAELSKTTVKTTTGAEAAFEARRRTVRGSDREKRLGSGSDDGADLERRKRRTGNYVYAVARGGGRGRWREGGMPMDH